MRPTLAPSLDLLWTSRLAPADAAAYDAFVDRAPGGHYAQTRAWAEVATAGRPMRPRWVLARDAGNVIGAALVLCPHFRGVPLPTAILERGPVTDRPEDVGRVSRAIAHAARKRGIARIQVMPYWSGEDVARAEAALAGARFERVQAFDGAHAVTLRLDIGGKSDDEILAGTDRKKLRYELRNAARAGVVVRRATRGDFAAFEVLDRELASSQARSPRRRAWYDAVAEYLAGDERRGALFISEHEGSPLATALVMRHGRTAVYYAGASILASRPFSKMASPLFAAVQWARDMGCETFDLGGVPLSGDVDAKRASIGQFKRDFAKTPVPLVGEHARWF